MGNPRPRQVVDTVFALGGESKWANWEIRYALRSLEKNFLDLGRVFVCTTKPPPWLVGAVVLPVPDANRHNKDANLIDKMLAACRAGVSQKFVRSSDDEMILLPKTVEQLLPYHVGPLGAKPKKFWEGGWKARMRATFDLLVKNGETTFHFDSHIPKVYDRTLFMELCKRYDYHSGRGFCIDTWYLNHVPHVRRFQLKGEKLTLEKPNNDLADLRARIAGKSYLGYNDNGLTPALKQLLQEMFPKPSRFEAR
jgi:hypothetical protein